MGGWLCSATRLGADHGVDGSCVDPVDAIMQLTAGRGVDVAIEALGTQATFEACLKVLRPGGTLSSEGVRAVRESARRGVEGGDHALRQGVGEASPPAATCPRRFRPMP